MRRDQKSNSEWPEWWEQARMQLQGTKQLSIFDNKTFSTPVWKRIEEIPTPTITARSWVVLDAITGRMIWGKNEHSRRDIASLTKIMTALVTIQLIDKLGIDPTQTYVQVSEFAVNVNGTSATLKENDILTVNDLLYGLMLPSGNDAALALSENFGVYLYFLSKDFILKYGYQEQITNLKISNPAQYFVREMNEMAQRLGLQNTYYGNTHGLTHRLARSTAYDIGKLCSVVIKNSYFQKIVNTKSYTSKVVNDGVQREIVWENTNKLLEHGFCGVKTGITNEAGPCLASHFKSRNAQYLLVILNSASKDERWVDTCKLLNWIAQIYEN